MANMRNAAFSGITGLDYYPAFLDAEQSAVLLAGIDAGPWRTVDSGQRIQEYGITQVFGLRERNQAVMKLNGPLPPWSSPLIERLIAEQRTDEMLNSILVLEYTDGRGIKPHVDSQHYGNNVFCISLGAPCTMHFRHKKNKEQPIAIPLEPGALLHMRDQARHAWLHWINEGEITEGRRVSVSIRSVKERFVSALQKPDA